MVVAEQQGKPPHHSLSPDQMSIIKRVRNADVMIVGLPWKWHMKDITPADPWTTIACHSFDSILLACDDSHNVVYVLSFQPVYWGEGCIDLDTGSGIGD